MATVSFDKSVIVKEPQAIDRLVASLKSGKAKKAKKELVSDTEMQRSEKLLKQCLHLKNS